MDGGPTPPLLVAWLNAASKYQAIDTSKKDSNDPTLQAQIKEALELLRALQKQIEAAAIFSKHEDAEDVVTGNIKYHLCEYYLGMLELKVVDGDRKAHCLRSKHHLTAFLENADKSGLVAKEDQKALRNDFADPGQRRLDLLARDKRDVVARKRLEELIKLKKEKVAAKGAEAVEESDADDEYERETIILTVHMAARKALRELDMTNRELEMLDMARNAPAPASSHVMPKGPAATKPQAKATAKPPPQSTPAQQQASLGKSRQQIINEVFQPGWIQPKYMVEDAVEIDIANGKIVQETDKSSSTKKKEDSDDEDDDEAVRKQRAWDDWKDTHPAGSGNRMRQG